MKNGQYSLNAGERQCRLTSFPYFYGRFVHHKIHFEMFNSISFLQI